MSAASAARVAEVARFERPPEALVTVEVRREGVAVVTIDDARGPDNAMTPALLRQLEDAIVRVQDDARVAAVVLASGKPSGFMSGADDAFLTSIRFAADAERWAAELAQAFAHIEATRKPVVAAVHGPALGAGYALALACHAIVASDDPATVVGLPEVHLGTVPPGNAALRAAVRAGLRAAIEVASTGVAVPARAAAALDLVDEVVPRAILFDAAVRHARALIGRVPRVRDERGGIDTVALEKNALGRGFLFRRARARATAAAESERRGHQAATLAIDVLRRFADKGFAEAAGLEARTFGQLAVTASAHQLLEAAAARTAVDRAADATHAGSRPIRNAAVVGGGGTGTGVAALAAMAGIGVRLKERDDETLGRALRTVRARVEALATSAAGAGLGGARDDLLDRVTGTSDLSGLRSADIVVEAIAEDLAVKQAVFGALDEVCKPGAVLATTTSSLPV
ncbi:MAG TPA: enoyl-CoA hydratase-related protein, partial [Polyangiaceae bacterium]|nr:enoyl-CoA hydratase-related protein [Polyangiaceae bacterium]